MEFKVSKEHMLRNALSTDMVRWVFWWERQKRYFGRTKQGPMEEKYYYNEILMIFWEEKMKRRENKRMVKLELFSKLPFLDIY